NLEDHLSTIPKIEGLDISLAITFGKNWVEILKQAEHSQADLIVMGLHRETGFEGMFRGTTVERVSQRSKVPVLVVKNRAVKDYQSVAVGVDFSISCRRAIEFALQITLRSQIRLVHAYDAPYK